jgi:hypothetical protein
VNVSGPLLFARYAYPPNALGYCGPPDSKELLGVAQAGDVKGVSGLARSFEGAWPYLELIAGHNHIDDPLDRRVVEAYWIGNELLDHIPPSAFIASLLPRFGRKAGHDGDAIWAAAVGGAAHHSFHVFAVYPWVGLLRSDSSGVALNVLDQCRIRSATVESVEGGLVMVRSRPLIFEGSRLSLGRDAIQAVWAPLDGPEQLVAGDVVAVHWNWICGRLSPSDVARLRSFTVRNLAVVNALPHPGPALGCERSGQA